MKRTFLFCFIIVVASACNRSPYVEQKLELVEKGKDCSLLEPTFRLTSNFGGERFEFEKCLPTGYDIKSMVTERKGDTVLVNFNPENKTSALYKVTLDIDSYPSYRFITIDGQTYPIRPTN
ncbi:MAG: hypothetical protein ABWZ25_05130 [Chitinophagaceae bacterium]